MSPKSSWRSMRNRRKRESVAGWPWRGNITNQIKNQQVLECQKQNIGNTKTEYREERDIVSRELEDARTNVRGAIRMLKKEEAESWRRNGGTGYWMSGSETNYLALMYKKIRKEKRGMKKAPNTSNLKKGCQRTFWKQPRRYWRNDPQDRHEKDEKKVCSGRNSVRMIYLRKAGPEVLNKLVTMIHVW